MKTKHPYFLIDVFTDKAFGGNPLAVFPEGDVIDDGLKQRIANELNLSETTFLEQPTDKSADVKIRIFTPISEIPMAGHPTIGTIYALLENGLLKPKGETIKVELNVGLVEVTVSKEKNTIDTITMSQPIPEFRDTIYEKEKVADILSIPTDAINSEYPIQIVTSGVPFIYVPLQSKMAVDQCHLKIEKLEEVLSKYDCQEIFVFSTETSMPNTDVYCRLFAPRFGIEEDPATGGAHGPLAGYLSKYGIIEEEQILSEQGVAMGRPSLLQVEIQKVADEIVGVKVGGKCVSIGKGEIIL